MPKKGGSLTTAEIRLACIQENYGSCPTNTCIIDMAFLQNIFKKWETNNEKERISIRAWDQRFSNPGVSPSISDFSKNYNGQKKCCGSFPYRYMFKGKEGGRNYGCCGNRVFMSSRNSVCCRNSGKVARSFKFCK